MSLTDDLAAVIAEAIKKVPYERDDEGTAYWPVENLAQAIAERLEQVGWYSPNNQGLWSEPIEGDEPVYRLRLEAKP